MRIQLCAILASSLLLTACGGVGNSATGTTQGAQSAAQQVNMNQIHQEVANAQSALNDAQSALGSIFTSSGSFNWSIFFGGVDFSTLGANTQTCLQNAFPTQNIAALVLTAPIDIATALKCITTDVITVAGIANTDLNTAMAVLNSSLAALPAGSPEATEIQAMITEVQTLQTTYNTTMQTLASQLSLAVTFLNTLPTLATGAIPVPVVSLLVGMTIDTFVQPIVAVVMQFQTQLQAL